MNVGFYYMANAAGRLAGHPPLRPALPVARARRLPLGVGRPRARRGAVAPRSPCRANTARLPPTPCRSGHFRGRDGHACLRLRPCALRRPRRSAEDAAVLKRLSTLDRFLPLWIGLAMAAGLGLGSLVPSLNDGLDKLQVGTVSLPIAIGLLVMMYPVLAKVRYEEIGRRRPTTCASASASRSFLSWIVGPALMFALAWLLLPTSPSTAPADHRRPRPLHRDGADLERPRRAAIASATALLVRLQRALPGRRLLAARLVLPERLPGLARPRHAGHSRSASGRSRRPC